MLEYIKIYKINFKRFLILNILSNMQNELKTA